MEENSLNKFKGYVGVKFHYSTHAYFFGFSDLEVKPGDKVVVETTHGPELGEICFDPIDISQYHRELELKPILRKANDVDLRLHENNIKDAKIALEICKNEVNNMKLDMNLISCEYTLDKSKVIFSYVADERVDFRELLKILAAKLHTRIELRQIGSRDKAKLIGGVGLCGLPLCCATFLNEFDGISINRAKNQMLAINIPKLSGHCGKLLCCLKYEDDAYTELKKGFPPVGTRVFIDKVEYEVTAINVVSKMVKIDNPDDSKFLSLEEFMKQTHYRPRPPRDDKDNNKPQNNQNNQNNKQKNNNKNEAR